MQLSYRTASNLLAVFIFSLSTPLPAGVPAFHAALLPDRQQPAGSLHLFPFHTVAGRGAGVPCSSLTGPPATCWQYSSFPFSHRCRQGCRRSMQLSDVHFPQLLKYIPKCLRENLPAERLLDEPLHSGVEEALGLAVDAES